MAERAASKIPDVPEDTPQREIKSVAVIGAGTMGGGISMNFLNAGIPVKILEMKQEALDRGIATIRKNYEVAGQEGQAEAGQVRRSAWACCRTTLDYDDLKDADLVIEAVFEEMGVKQKVFETARRSDEARRDPGLQHLDAGRRQDRRRSPSGRRTSSACTSSARPT